MHIKDILRTASSTLNSATWGQKQSIMSGCRVCAAMAVQNLTVYNDASESDTAKALMVLAKTIYPNANELNYIEVVVDWNDAAERTLAEVHAKFDEAISSC